MRIQSEPKYRQLAARLTADIASGRLRPGEKLAGERELAKRYGISHPTMNKALGGLVESGVLERRPGVGTFVSAVRAQGAGTDAILMMMDLTPTAHMPFLPALPRYLSQIGRMPVLLDGARGTGCEARFESVVRDGMTCIMHFCCDVPFARLQRAATTCRFVFIGEYVWQEKLPGSYVLCDFEAGGRMAAQHLVARGRERFLLLTAPSHFKNRTPLAWEHGIRSVLQESGLPAPRTICAAEATGEDYREIFGAGQPPDAVLANADFRLVEMLQAIAPLGLKVGDDFDAIGQYDTPWAEAWGLTSLSIGVERILGHLGGALSSNHDIDVRVAPNLVHRQSSPSTGY